MALVLTFLWTVAAAQSPVDDLGLTGRQLADANAMAGNYRPSGDELEQCKRQLMAKYRIAQAPHSQARRFKTELCVGGCIVMEAACSGACVTAFVSGYVLYHVYLSSERYR